MRFKRRGVAIPMVRDGFTKRDSLHIQARTKEIREAASDCIKALEANAEVAKSQVDNLKQILVEKFERLAERAKTDIDSFVRAEAEKSDTSITAKLAELDHRLSKAMQLPGRASRFHQEQRISTLLADMQQLTQSISLKQIDFKLHDKCRDFIKSVSNLGKPKWRRKNNLPTAGNGTTMTRVPLNECLEEDSAQALAALFDETCGDLVSSSSSSNGSVNSMYSASLDSIERDYSSTLSIASSGFMLVDSYHPSPLGLTADVLVDPAESIDSMFESSDPFGSLYDSSAESNIDEASIDETNERVLSINVIDFDNAINNNKKMIIDDECSPVATVPFDESAEVNIFNEEMNRHLDEISWKSSITVYSEYSEDGVGHRVARDIVIDSGIKIPPISLTYSTEFQTCDHRSFCVIPDITILQDHRLALADHYHNNVQFYDKDLRLISEEKCPYPMGVCKVDRNTVAVSLRRTSQITLFRVEEKHVKRIRDITVPCSVYIWNLTYKANRFFVVCDQNNVHVLTLDGTETRLVKTGVPVESGYIRYFDVSDDGSMLYLCEGLGLRLRCVDIYGNHVWSLKSSDIPGNVQGLEKHAVEDVCYTNGRLLATNWMLSKVFEISLDGKYVTDIITTNLESPRAMSIYGDKLVVTQFNPNIDNCKKRTVKVFKVGFS